MTPRGWLGPHAHQFCTLTELQAGRSRHAEQKLRNEADRQRHDVDERRIDDRQHDHEVYRPHGRERPQHGAKQARSFEPERRRATTTAMPRSAAIATWIERPATTGDGELIRSVSVIPRATIAA